jgi:hypothetical protein
MSGKTLAYWMALAASLAGCGCGTVANMRERGYPPFNLDGFVSPQSPYGGLTLDARLLELSVGATLGLHPDDLGLTRVGTALASFLFLADMPLSAVGDTATLPVTLGRDKLRRTESRDTAQ